MGQTSYFKKKFLFYFVCLFQDGTPTTKTFEHVSSEIGAEEAEEVGVEHLLRDIKVSKNLLFVTIGNICFFLFTIAAFPFVLSTVDHSTKQLWYISLLLKLLRANVPSPTNSQLYSSLSSICINGNVALVNEQGSIICFS